MSSRLEKVTKSCRHKGRCFIFTFLTLLKALGVFLCRQEIIDYRYFTKIREFKVTKLFIADDLYINVLFVNSRLDC